MKKITLTLLFILPMLSGCKKEVYLQPVPCTKDCKPCFIGLEASCPETDLMTEKQVYLIEDVEKPTVDYTILDNGKVRRCKHVCKQNKISQ